MLTIFQEIYIKIPKNVYLILNCLFKQSLKFKSKAGKLQVGWRKKEPTIILGLPFPDVISHQDDSFNGIVNFKSGP